MADYPLLCPTEDEKRKGKEDEGKKKGGRKSRKSRKRRKRNREKSKMIFGERENKKGESLGFETLSFTFFSGEGGGDPIPPPLSRFLKTAASYSPTVTQYHRHRWA